MEMKVGTAVVLVALGVSVLAGYSCFGSADVSLLVPQDMSVSLMVDGQPVEPVERSKFHQRYAVSRGRHDFAVKHAYGTQTYLLEVGGGFDKWVLPVHGFQCFLALDVSSLYAGSGALGPFPVLHRYLAGEPFDPYDATLSTSLLPKSVRRRSGSVRLLVALPCAEAARQDVDPAPWVTFDSAAGDAGG